MFDARAARALQPGDHLTVDGAPGLRLVAGARTRAWVYRYKSPVDARMRQLRLGRWPAMPLAAALAAWQRAREQRDAGADLAADKRASARASADKPYTVRRACDDFLADYRGRVADKTHAEAARTLERDAAPIADRPLAGITRADAFDLLHAMRERPVQAANLRRTLGAVWDRAHDAGRLAPDVPNWWRLVLRGKLKSAGKPVAGQRGGVVKRVLSEAELALLLPWLPNFSRDVADVLALTLWTCCRSGEVCAMRAEEVASERGVLWWTIPRARLKMRRHALLTDLRVPLVGRAAAIVRRRIDAHAEDGRGWLFPSVGRSGHVEQKAIGVACWAHQARCTSRPEWVRPRLTVADFAPHDLRRTGRTLLAALGCPNDVAEAILGHIAPGVQAVYNRHQYDAERLRWLTRLAERLQGLSTLGGG